MKILRRLSHLMLLTLLLASCSKEEATLQVATGLEGTWTARMVLSNDYWGAPLYWRDVQSDEQVRFTTDGQYYEKEDGESSFTLVGSYEVVAEDELKITEIQPAFPEYASHVLYYSFEPGGYLVLRKQQFEGAVAGKYQLAE